MSNSRPHSAASLCSALTSERRTCNASLSSTNALVVSVRTPREISANLRMVLSIADGGDAATRAKRASNGRTWIPSLPQGERGSRPELQPRLDLCTAAQSTRSGAWRSRSERNVRPLLKISSARATAPWRRLGESLPQTAATAPEVLSNSANPSALRAKAPGAMIGTKSSPCASARSTHMTAEPTAAVAP
eukprot:Amastigsp_a346678_25.p2 type:complete len:190 gc:universal Amastigsp_a346678_25:260-829(+)